MELEVDRKSESMDANETIRKFTWRIQNFSSIKDEFQYSEIFIVDGIKWRIQLFTSVSTPEQLAIWLEVADSETLPSGWHRFAQFGFAIIDQIDRKTSATQVGSYEFEQTLLSGSVYCLALSELHNPKSGYLVNDECLVEVYISTSRIKDLISHELIVETDSNKHKIKEADRVKAEQISSTTSSSTQPYCQSVPIVPEEPTEEDIATFFTSLESELSSSNVVSSQEAAKEALDKLDEALNMTPANFHDSGKFSPLKQAFKILASLDCSSTTLTIKQKNELLAMEESLKELADRAARALQDKNCFIAKESTKQTITRNLECSLTRYKEVESDVKHVEQKLAALHEQAEEAQKKREIMLAERKGIFKNSKIMKTELEALGNKWAEYEAKAKVAEAEEKTVEAKWGRMKDFISSIKRMI